MKELEIHAFYDEEAKVWIAEHDEIGLATEADSIEVLAYKLKEMIPELVTLNNIPRSRPVMFSLITHQTVTAFS